MDQSLSSKPIDEPHGVDTRAGEKQCEIARIDAIVPVAVLPAKFAGYSVTSQCTPRVNAHPKFPITPSHLSLTLTLSHTATMARRVRTMGTDRDDPTLLLY